MSHIISDIHRTGFGSFIFIPTFRNDQVPAFSAATLTTDLLTLFANDLPFTEESIGKLSGAMTAIRNAISARVTYITSIFNQEVSVTAGTLDIRYFIIPIMLIDHETDERRVTALYVPPDVTQRMVMLAWSDTKYCADNVMLIEGWLDFSELKEFDERWTMHLLDPLHHEVTLEEDNFKITLTSNEILDPLSFPEESMHITTIPANSKPDLLRVKSYDDSQVLNIDLTANSLKQRRLRNIEFVLNVTPAVAETMYANPGVHEYLQDGFTDKTIH